MPATRRRLLSGGLRALPPAPSHLNGLRGPSLSTGRGLAASFVSHPGLPPRRSALKKLWRVGRACMSAGMSVAD
eukprot:2540631-Lingulodinium_polyedra.AAC.1